MVQQLFRKIGQQMLKKIGQQLFKKIGQQMLTKIGQQLFHTIEPDGRQTGANQQMLHTIETADGHTIEQWCTTFFSQGPLNNLLNPSGARWVSRPKSG